MSSQDPEDYTGGNITTSTVFLAGQVKGEEPD